MKLRSQVAKWRAYLADAPLLARDLWHYARFRGNVYRELEACGRSIAPVECVGLMNALERIHRHRFPDRPWPGRLDVGLALGEECDSLEVIYLALICRIAEPEMIFEIGTYEGRTANTMALHTDPSCRIHTLDLPPEGATTTHLPVSEGDRMWLEKKDTTTGRLLGTLPDPALNKKIQSLFGDSATFDFSPFRASMDMVFVDGAHSYDYVMSDVRNALTLLKPGGFILMHDLLTHAGVTLAATVLSGQHEIIHVAQTTFAVLFPASESVAGGRSDDERQDRTGK